MVACPNGAEPQPDWLGKTINPHISWLPQPVQDLIRNTSPLTFEQQIVGNLVVDTLCTGNPTDPGDLSLGDLAWDIVGTAIPNPNGDPNTIGWWVGQKLQYMAFWQVCQCIDTAAPPPPAVTPTPPAGQQPYPTGPENQPPLVRIETNTSDSNAGLLTLYNGVMELNAQIGDMSWYARPNFVGSGGYTLGSISGEGRMSLAGFPQSDQYLGGDLAGLRVLVTQLPTKYKQRGTLVPRYYGIGSIMWLTSDPQSGVDSVSERTSIHYLNQFLPMPPMAFHPRIAYRLMPGAQATVQVIPRAVTGAWYGNQGWDERALLRLDQDTPPAGWTDSPFYPRPASSSRVFALGARP